MIFGAAFLPLITKLVIRKPLPTVTAFTLWGKMASTVPKILCSPRSKEIFIWCSARESAIPAEGKISEAIVSRRQNRPIVIVRLHVITEISIVVFGQTKIRLFWGISTAE